MFLKSSSPLGHHASYYPGAHEMHLKLFFDTQSGAIYGIQGIGRLSSSSHLLSFSVLFSLFNPLLLL